MARAQVSGRVGAVDCGGRTLVFNRHEWQPERQGSLTLRTRVSYTLSERPLEIASMRNQRRHERLGINEEFASIDDFIAEYVTDISRGGVFIRSKQPLPVGTKVNLKFSVILEDFETIEGEGEVVRVVPDGEHAGMGVVFSELTEESRAIIEELVKRNEAAAAAAGEAGEE